MLNICIILSAVQPSMMILPRQSHIDNKFYYLFKRANKIMFVFGMFIIVWELHGEVI